MKLKKVTFTVRRRKAYLEDLEYAKKLRKIFSYSVPGARFSYAFNHFKQDAAGRPLKDKDGKWIRLWDGTESIMKMNSLSIGLLLAMKEDLKKEGFDAAIDRWKDKPAIGTRKGFRSEDERYAYQNNCVDAMLSSVRQGGGLVLSATGTGKTAISAQFASHCIDPICFVVDQVNLLTQAKKEIEYWLHKNGLKEKVGIVRAKTFDPGHVTVATIQTLHAHRHQSSLKRWMKTVKVVILDEVHKQMSKRNFSIVNNFATQICIGLTASLQLRKKQIRMKAYSICGPVIFEFPIVAAQKKGVLTKGAVLQVSVPQENFTDRNANNAYECDVVCNRYAHDAVYRIISRALRLDHSVIVLVNRIKHVKELKKFLSDFEPRVVYGKVKQDRREAIQKKFEKEQHRVIIASDVFTKGVNIKRVDVIIDAAQRQSKDDCIQKFGRGVRLHEKKDVFRYFSIHTLPAMKKAAGSQKTAFHRAKIPVKRVEFQSGKQCFEEIDKLLKKGTK